MGCVSPLAQPPAFGPPAFQGGPAQTGPPPTPYGAPGPVGNLGGYPTSGLLSGLLPQQAVRSRRRGFGGHQGGLLSAMASGSY